MLAQEIKSTIDRSVLCWLATSSPDNQPNVSPKEAFTYWENNIIIANIASPQTVKNILLNNKVSISFIDIWVQKGWQIKGMAKIVEKEDPYFSKMEKELLKMTKGKFPFSSIITISVVKTKPILAPSYLLYPETTENDQINNAIKAYGVATYLKE